MEEFALCWNKLKFAENLSTGFQSLFDRGDFVDCTIACDGQLLQCHKLVLAICSPYFKEIFINNPCRHPIIILKDVTYSIMSELLQFMYQGEVNVKQAELQSFMSIAESLQIKGLATGSSNNNNSQATKTSDAVNSPFSQFHANNNQRNHNQHHFHSGGNHTEHHRQTTATPLSTTSSVDNHSVKATKMGDSIMFGHKRTHDQSGIGERMGNSMKMKRVHDISDNDMNDSIDNMNSDEIFLSQTMQPQVTISESPRYEATSVKRENNDVAVSQPQSPSNVYRNSYQNSNTSSMQNASYPYNFSDFSNADMSMQNELKPSNHMALDIPAGTGTNLSNVTMLSATSLLHNSMIFNRNNTVATQQGMKTYWLCRSYRLTTCRARCITAQGRIMSTTGTHNHPPHVKSAGGSKMDLTSEHSSQAFAQPLSNQIHNLPSATTSPGMINQHQMSANMNFGGNTAPNNNNFSMTNILNEMDPNSLLTQSSGGLNQMENNIQITPIINASIDQNLNQNLQMQQHQQQLQRNVMNGSNIHVEMAITILPGERWICGKLEFMLSQRGKPLLVHDGYSFGIQYIRKDKKYWQCNLSRKYNCKARVTTTDAGDIIVTNNEHCHTEIRQHLRKDYKMNKLHNQLNNQLSNHYMSFADRKLSLPYMQSTLSSVSPSISTTTTSIMPRQSSTSINSYPKNLSISHSRSPSNSPPSSPPTSPKCSMETPSNFN